MSLIDREALRVEIGQWCGCEISDVLDLIDAQPTVELPRWIPVAERLPEDGKTVVVVDGFGLLGTAYYKGGWYGMVIEKDITHWLDGLKLPKEG